jgi:hypothetical protein
MNGEVWVKLGMGLAVVPISLLDEIKEHWTGKIADAVMRGVAIVNVGLDGGSVNGMKATEHGGDGDRNEQQE